MESLAARFIGLSAEGGFRPGVYAGLNERRLAGFVSPVYRALATGHEPRKRG
jgi:hypothetical protein